MPTSDRITLRLSSELKEKLRTICFETRVSKNKLIVTAIEHWLKTVNKKNTDK